MIALFCMKLYRVMLAFGSKEFYSWEDTEWAKIRTLAVTLDFKNSNPTLLHDTPSINDVQSHQVRSTKNNNNKKHFAKK